MLAEALREWLPDVVVVARPWFSDKDIDKGSRWSEELAEQLSTTDLAIVCVTPENVDSAWMVFEAGSLSKSRNARVWIYVLDGPVPIGSPLRQFQYTNADEIGTRDLICSIGERILPSDTQNTRFLTRQFERCWPDLRTKLERVRNVIPKFSSTQGRLSVEDILRRGPELLRYIGTIPASENLVAEVVRRFGRTPPADKLGPATVAAVTKYIFDQELRSAEVLLEGFGFTPESRVSLILQILFYGVFDHGA